MNIDFPIYNIIESLLRQYKQTHDLNKTDYLITCLKLHLAHTPLRKINGEKLEFAVLRIVSVDDPIYEKICQIYWTHIIRELTKDPTLVEEYLRNRYLTMSPLGDVENLQRLKLALAQQTELVHYIDYLCRKNQPTFKDFPSSCLNTIARFLTERDRGALRSTCQAISKKMFNSSVSKFEETVWRDGADIKIFSEQPEAAQWVQKLQFENYDFGKNPLPLHHFRNVKILTLYSCKEMSTEYLKSIAPVLESIEILNLRNCPFTSFNELNLFGKKIKELNVYDYKSDLDPKFYDVLLNLKQLVKINFPYFHLDNVKDQLAYVEQLVPAWQNVEEIEFKKLSESDASLLFNALKKLKRLKVIELSHFNLKSGLDSYISSLAMNCTHLTVLEIINQSSWTPIPIFDKPLLQLKFIKELVLISTAIRLSAEFFKGMCEWKNLEILMLVYDDNEKAQWTDEKLINLGPALTNVRELDLSFHNSSAVTAVLVLGWKP